MKNVLPERLKMGKMIPVFRMQYDRHLYIGKICVLWKSESTIIQMAYDSKLGSHFNFAKRKTELSKLYWRHKARDLKSYVNGYVKRQQFKGFNQRRLTNHEVLEMSERRLGSLVMDFITGLQRIKDRFAAVSTWVDRMSKKCI